MVLIIYNIPGESLLLFKTEANNFNRCHGHYVNTVDIDPEIEELILKIKDECEQIYDDTDSNDIWLNVRVTRVIVTGELP